MPAWTKVKPVKTITGRDPRKTFGVRRNRSGSRSAALLLPSHIEVPENARASVYSDGNGRIAFAVGASGEYKVIRAKGAEKSSKLTIPSQYAERIPYGTRDAEVTFDGDMMVLDLSQFS